MILTYVNFDIFKNLISCIELHIYLITKLVYRDSILWSMIENEISIETIRESYMLRVKIVLSS